MSKIKGTIVSVLIIFVIGVIGLVFLLQNVATNGYNPYSTSCKDACFKKLKVDASIGENGITTFTEEIKAFREKKGNFVYFEHYYDKQYGEAIDQSSVTLVDSPGILKPEFTIEGTKTKVRFKILTEFQGEETFKVSYKVKGLVKQLQDGQIFKYNFFNNEYSRPVINAHFNIQVPKSTFSKTNVYFDGLKNQKTISKNESTSTISIDVPKEQHVKQYYEVNMAFTGFNFTNASAIPNAKYKTLSEFNKEVDKMKAENENLDNKARNVIFMAFVYFVAISAISFLILGIMYKYRGKQHRKINKDVAFWQIPSDIGPASAAMIIDKSNFADLGYSFKAGLLYLVGEGYITLQKVNNTVEVQKQKEIDNQNPGEIIALYNYLFARGNIKVLGGAEALKPGAPDDVKNYEAYKLAAIQSFRNLDLFDVDKGTKNGGFQEVTNRINLKINAILIAIVTLLLYGGAIFFYNQMTAAIVLCMIVSVSLIALLIEYYIKITRFRADKIELYEQWIGFKLYLSTYTLLKERSVADVAVWKKYLAYATAFGVADNVIKVLKVNFPEIYTEMNTDVLIGTILYAPSINITPQFGTSQSSGGFGGGGSFGGGSFGGGGSGGGGGGFG